MFLAAKGLKNTTRLPRYVGYDSQFHHSVLKIILSFLFKPSLPFSLDTDNAYAYSVFGMTRFIQPVLRGFGDAGSELLSPGGVTGHQTVTHRNTPAYPDQSEAIRSCATRWTPVFKLIQSISNLFKVKNCQNRWQLLPG
jgi:hypothetical protein